MPTTRRKRCEVPGCGTECLAPWVAAPIVVGACSLALFVPFLDSVGGSLSSTVTWGTKLTFWTIIIVVTWAISIAVGVFRRHEDVMFCLIDALGLPGALVAIMLAVKL